MKVQDLDVLRPEPRIVTIGGKGIDVSFIPCAITFDVDAVVRELSVLTQDEIKNDPPKTRRAFELSVKLCAIFCAYKYPELDEEWFLNNTNVNQIAAFAEAIKDALSKAYAGIEVDSKNLKAPRKKSR